MSAPPGTATTADLRAGPAVIPLWPDACQALGIGRTLGYELAARGEFPVRVLRLGRAYRISTADLVRFLGGDPA